MHWLRERHYMAIISGVIYGLSFLSPRLYLQGSFGYLYTHVGQFLYSLYGFSFILAAVFFLFYRKAHSWQLLLAALPQLVYSFISWDYVRTTPNAVWQSPLFHTGFSFTFLLCIAFRYYRYKYMQTGG